MLLVSQSTSPSIEEPKPEAQTTVQTNLGTGMHATLENKPDIPTIAFFVWNVPDTLHRRAS
jgi:hypothetical protein